MRPTAARLSWTFRRCRGVPRRRLWFGLYALGQNSVFSKQIRAASRPFLIQGFPAEQWPCARLWTPQFLAQMVTRLQVKSGPGNVFRYYGADMPLSASREVLARYPKLVVEVGVSRVCERVAQWRSIRTANG